MDVLNSSQNAQKSMQKVHEKCQKYTKNAQEKIETASQFNSINISMAYIQNDMAFTA